MYWLAGLCIGWLDCIVCIGWLDRIVSHRCITVLLDIAGAGSVSYCLYWLDWIGCIILDNNGWIRIHSYCKDETDGNDRNYGLDGELMGLG